MKPLTDTQLFRLERYAAQIVVPSSVVDTISISCATCSAITEVKFGTLVRKRAPVPYKCKKCRCNEPQFKEKVSKIVVDRWVGGIYVEDVKARRTDATRKSLMSQQSKSRWADPDYRSKAAAAVDREKISHGTKVAMASKKQEISARSKRQWADPDYRKAQCARARARWADPTYRTKLHAVLASQPRVSRIQQTLYSLLDDLKVVHYKERTDSAHDPECQIGPFCFDCVIPRPAGRTLLIECQGEYWHSLPNSIRRDNAKASYIINNFNESYELKYLWEHEFAQLGKVRATLEYWLGIATEPTINYEFSDLVIKECIASEYKELLGKYHYLPNAGRGGIAYGAYLGEQLAAVCVFSPLSRQNIETHGVLPEETRDLSRLCVHPAYRTHNLASWFISKCIKRLPKKYKLIIAYSDTTYNHTGGVYKAANFVEAQIVPPDYWYVDNNGWVMHKKTLYNRARSLGMIESDYAAKHGMVKTWGREKKKFVYER